MCMLRVGLVKNCRRCKSSDRPNANTERKPQRKHSQTQLRRKNINKCLDLFLGAIVSRPSQKRFNRGMQGLHV